MPAARWVQGARPRTLPAAIVPVLVGTAAVADERFVVWRFVAALVVALALQIATNYANDYSDGVRGTDDDRVGPTRLVASGEASPEAVKRAVLVAFGVAGVAGLALALAASLWLLPVGVASIAAGWFYTGGSRPYGYIGLGEVFVFVFFGLVATVGSAYVQIESIFSLAFVLAIAVGLLATALLVVNNLRDRERDEAAGKLTLAVRIGDRLTRLLYVGMLIGPFAIVAVAAATYERAGVALGLVGAVVAIPPIRDVSMGATGHDLIPVLGATGRVQLVTGVALSVGLLI